MTRRGTDYFPPDYATARDRFRLAADRLGWRRDAHPIPGTGPLGESLTIDAAFSPGDADRVLVVSSGLHGVEGPLGTAIQLAAMDRWADGGALADEVRVVFLHALNPQGYVLGRRTDAANVDPNRNFLLPDQEFRGSPAGYKQFDNLLNPKSPPQFVSTFLPRALLSRMRYGLPALKQALVAGQYDFPKGIFFGGHGPCDSQIALRERLPDWLNEAASVLHLDVHTGLGRWGTYKLLLDPPTTDEHRERMERWFGSGTFEEDDPNGVAYVPSGGFGPWCREQGLAPDYLYAVAEFGTYGHVQVVGGLRQENRAYHWGQPDSVYTQRAKARLKELFCPADPAWRLWSLNEGLQLIERGVHGLNELARTRTDRSSRAA